MKTRHVLIPALLVAVLTGSANIALAAPATETGSLTPALGGWDMHPDYDRAKALGNQLVAELNKAQRALDGSNLAAARHALAASARRDQTLRDMMPRAASNTASAEAQRQLLPLRVSIDDRATYIVTPAADVQPGVDKLGKIDQEKQVMATHIVYLPVVDIGAPIASARQALAQPDPDVGLARSALKTALNSLVRVNSRLSDSARS